MTADPTSKAHPIDAAPVDPSRIDAAMAVCLPRAPAGLAVACSGGADSMALALLLKDWAAARSIPFRTYTVDHGLRPEAAEEAASVCHRLGVLGIRADVLRGESERAIGAGGDIQARARELRYRLLLDRCRADGVEALAFAHHLEDQAETFLLRLARGSGVDGLSAMMPAREWAGVRLIRPLLAMPKSALTAHLRAAGVAWVEDPSNRDTRFDRVRVRQARAALDALGLTPERLAGTARRMARARAALEGDCDALLTEASRDHETGYITVAIAPLRDASEEVGLRALARLVCRVGGRVHPPRLDRLERLRDALLDGTLGRGRTLAGTVVSSHGADHILVRRELATVREDAPLAPEVLWDGRFSLHFPVGAMGTASAYRIGALGLDGWRYLRRVDRAAGRRGEALPGTIRPTLPALWRGEELAHAPHLQPDGPLIEEAPRVERLSFAGPRS
ncbi:tRNA lysidine(34) synthetase TilS [Marivibrio halodurans]|uniref:tRNA(Ile)-lysidine synthase n=1 Tax=Marivibrio halodurans TaxID=2039722 RepID=A0A8J7V381_9PROT|nr:tRNA lysidine(34) synthetase TilS [Marivibrio halodurans]MBP5857682.1 tRNA lysidine(34) synthetase TilS [Marivibrio halodurans]